MARLNIDVSGATSRFSPIPEGEYRVKVVSADLVESKSSGRPMVKFTYEVVGGEYAGRKLFDNAVIGTDGGDFLIHQWCVASSADPTDPDTQDFPGAEADAQVTVRHDPQYGEQNNVLLLVEIPKS
jgi:hypothetical protein